MGLDVAQPPVDPGEKAAEASPGYDEVTKYYTVTMKKGRRGRFTSKLHVNFSFQTVGYSAFGDPFLKSWVCRGDDSFSAR